MLHFPDDASLGRHIAFELAEIVRKKPDALLCIAAGTSSYPVFDAVNALVRSGKLDLSKATFFGMDEWCGLPQDADGAMADFLRKHFLEEAGFGEVFLFDGMADPVSECTRAEAFLQTHGGFDAIVFGIGVNGHVALNEPGVDPALRTHVADVAPVTATVAQKYFEHKAPALHRGVTIGIANAREAAKLYLVANTANKRNAVEKLNVSLQTTHRTAPFPLRSLQSCRRQSSASRTPYLQIDLGRRTRHEKQAHPQTSLSGAPVFLTESSLCPPWIAKI